MKAIDFRETFPGAIPTLRKVVDKKGEDWVRKVSQEPIFRQLAKTGRALGVGKADAREAQKWYREQAMKIRGVDVNKLVESTPKSKLFSRPSASDVGSMLMFFYDPKLKATLPYYDQFPLIFPIDFQNDRFLSINLHYLPPVLRARLMDALYTLAIKEENKITRLKLSYDILKSASKFAPFKPCIKTHLFSHVRSRFVWVPPSDWDKALLLPTQRFVGASSAKVWRDSEQSLRKRK